MSYLVVDIETVPINAEAAMQLDDEEQKKLLNPIDSRIVAIGVRKDGVSTIWCEDDERAMLVNFWEAWKTKGPNAPVVGFNIASFDIPFLVTRSFLLDVPVVPFSVKDVVDLREKLSAYRHGHSRGKLKEFAQLIGLSILDVDGSDVTRLWTEQRIKELVEYLNRDLEITDELYARAVRLHLTRIVRW